MSLHYRSLGSARLLFWGALVLGASFLFWPGGEHAVPAQDKPPPKSRMLIEASAEVEQAQKEKDATAKDLEQALQERKTAQEQRREVERRPLEDPPRTQEQRQKYDEDIKHWRNVEEETVRNLTVKTLADTAARKQLNRLTNQLNAVRAQETGTPAESAPPLNPIGHIAPRLGPTFAWAQDIDQALQKLKPIGLPLFRDPPSPGDPNLRDPVRYLDPRIIPPSVEAQIAGVQAKWEPPLTPRSPKTGPGVPDVGASGPVVTVVQDTTWSGGGGTFRFSRGGGFVYSSRGEQMNGSWRQSGNVVESSYQKRYPYATMTVEFRITLENGTAQCQATISGVDVRKDSYTIHIVK